MSVVSVPSRGPTPHPSALAGALAFTLAAGLVAATATPAVATSPRAAPAGLGPLVTRSAGDDLHGGTFSGSLEVISSSRYQRAIEDGIEFLAANQERDGSFAGRNGRLSAPIAVTALGSLAILASGSTPSRGPHAHTLRRTLTFLVDHCDESGHFTAEGDVTSRMHGQGFATLALAEAYGMSGEEAELPGLPEALERAVRLCEGSQSSVGGWMYEPVKSSEHEGSVTICIVQALRSARDAGLKVDAGVIANAVGYVRKSQKADGSFRYMLGSTRSSYALTAAAISTLNATGEYDSHRIDQGLDFMLRFENGEVAEPFVEQEDPWPEYTRLYAAQAYAHYRDPRRFEAWFPREASRCLDEQDPETGAWTNHDYGALYATAMQLLFLQVPRGYLPAFQR